ncbi:MAG: peptidoglycan DD-metalloendopeptidase family protein [Verrucomicrobia bacterium]|nr:peptidoglycan DD-metalloendopeptidase family protein [Verrucomicrobiota bacterium]
MIPRCLMAQVWLALLLGATAATAATAPIAPIGAPATTTANDSDYTKAVRKLIGFINTDNQDKIHQMLASTMRGALPEIKARSYFRDILGQRGKLLGIKDSVAGSSSTGVLVEAEQGLWNFALTLDRKGLIATLNITPVGPVIVLPERNKTLLQLPFNGEWYVRWGGITPELNRHSSVRSQRRALDAVIRDPQNKTYKNEGKANEDYYAYGVDIFAPADGLVSMVIDGVPDNEPGSQNDFCAIGNCIMIKHSDSEFSVLAHLMPGSLRVKVGDTVKVGQLIGKCGNSGDSSEPHLHFHLQNLPVMQDASGFEPYFQNVRVTRNQKTRVEKDYSPIRGDTIAPQETK